MIIKSPLSIEGEPVLRRKYKSKESQITAGTSSD